MLVWNLILKIIYAYRFYNIYAGFVGFSIRKDWRNKSKLYKEIVISRKFSCFKEGFKRIKDEEGKVTRKDIRTGCSAHRMENMWLHLLSKTITMNLLKWLWIMLAYFGDVVCLIPLIASH
jgi:hypothetical protein